MRAAMQFKVENTKHDGSLTNKSNCKFLEIYGEKFTANAVDMKGDNTFDHDPAYGDAS